MNIPSVVPNMATKEGISSGMFRSCSCGRGVSYAVVVAVVMLATVNVAQCLNIVESNNDLDKFFQPTEAQRTKVNERVDSKPSLGLMWGIADTTAHVGRFFNYSIPADAFKGKTLHYLVRIV